MSVQWWPHLSTVSKLTSCIWVDEWMMTETVICLQGLIKSSYLSAAPTQTTCSIELLRCLWIALWLVVFRSDPGWDASVTGVWQTEGCDWTQTEDGEWEAEGCQWNEKETVGQSSSRFNFSQQGLVHSFSNILRRSWNCFTKIKCTLKGKPIHKQNRTENLKRTLKMRFTNMTLKEIITYRALSPSC